jgi:serine O-acetyltransferase
MRQKVRLVLTALRWTTVLPLTLVQRIGPNQQAIRRDIIRQPHERSHEVLTRPEYRGVLYTRFRNAGHVWGVVAWVLGRVWRETSTLEIKCGDIGPGLFIAHGYATVIIAQRLGCDCSVWQGVTVGFSDRGGPPVIGDRVRIYAGAKVIGPISVGDGAVIGANAVVVRDVPPGAVMVGVPAVPLKTSTVVGH